MMCRCVERRRVPKSKSPRRQHRPGLSPSVTVVSSLTSEGGFPFMQKLKCLKFDFKKTHESYLRNKRCNILHVNMEKVMFDLPYDLENDNNNKG